MLRHVDLCSGIGGFALGFEWAGLSRPVMFCDIEPWSRKILAKHWPDVPIQEDVKVLANDARRLVPDCDILTAGYPCQPFSVAGKQKGTEDDRHIWPYIFRIVAQKRPTWCVFENVYGHVALGLDQVLADLEAEGYACRTYIVPACGVDAPHRRDRLWIVAHTNSKGEPDGTINEQRMVGHTEDNGCQRRGEATGRKRQTHQLQQQPSVRGKLSRPSEHVAYTNGKGLEGYNDPDRQGDWQSRRQQVADKGFSGRNAGDFWKSEPNVGRVANGIPGRMDRIKGLGNAVVPQIAMQIGIAIRQCEVGALPSVESVKGS